MYLRQFEHLTDLETLNAWRAGHGLVAVPGSEVPKLGIIVPDLGMAFVRMAEGNLGIFDSLITNPAASAEDRHRALDMLYPAIVAVAQNAGCTRIWGITTDTGTFMRATQHGFQLSPCVLLVRE